MLDTSKIQDRRRLRHVSIDDLLADIDRIVAADIAGTLRRTGNWTAGQAFGHLAAWINFAWEGYPAAVSPPWLIRLLIRTKKIKYLRDGMDAGIHIPRVQNGTVATDLVSTEEGANRLRKALQRLKSGEAPKYDSPAWGKMPLEERIAMNLRHAELHLSFLHL